MLLYQPKPRNLKVWQNKQTVKPILGFVKFLKGQSLPFWSMSRETVLNSLFVGLVPQRLGFIILVRGEDGGFSWGFPFIYAKTPC